MRKFSFLFLFFIVLSTFIFSNEPITLDLLVKGNWGPELPGIGTFMAFYKDYSCKVFYHYGQDGEQFNARFAINKNSITIYSSEGDGVIYADMKLATDQSSPIYRKYLYIDEKNNKDAVDKQNYLGADKSKIVWDRDSILAPNTKFTSNGLKCVSVGGMNGAVVTNVKFRVSPDIKAKTIEYTYYTGKNDEDPFETETIDYVPAGVEIIVYARTENKVKIDKWDNYWYLVSIPSGTGYVYYKGWMYGEFIKVSNEKYDHSSISFFYDEK